MISFGANKNNIRSGLSHIVVFMVNGLIKPGPGTLTQFVWLNILVAFVSTSNCRHFWFGFWDLFILP